MHGVLDEKPTMKLNGFRFSLGWNKSHKTRSPKSQSWETPYKSSAKLSMVKSKDQSKFEGFMNGSEKPP